MATAVGLTIFSQTTTDWAAGQTFNSYVGRPYSTQSRKVYVDTWPPPGTVQGDLLGTPGYIHSGTRLWLCYKPPYRTSTGSYNTDYAAMKTDINAYIAAFQAAGQQVKIKICLWQEVNNPAHGISAAQYLSIMQFYYPKLHADFPTHPVCFDASGSYSATAASYYPKAGGTVYCDEAGMDLYCTRYYNGHNADALITKAAADGIPFGFPEIGASLPGDTLNTTAQFNSFILGYVLPNMTGSDVGWYDSHHTNPDNDVTGPGDYKVPALKSLFDALQGGKAGNAAVNTRFTLTANGQIPGGTTKFASAPISAALTLSATGTRAGSHPAAFIGLSFTLATSGGAGGPVLQQVQGVSTFDYGLSSVEIATQPGSTLLVLAGWDLSTSPTGAPVPAAYVSDSAGVNNWIHVATTPASVTGSRCTAWICPNAQAIEWLSVSLTTFGSSLAYTVLELDGNTMPQFYSLDVLDAVASMSAAGLALNPGVTIDTDFAFAVVATGGFTSLPGLTSSAAWQALSSVSTTGGGTQNQTQIFPFIAEPAPGTDMATTFALPQAIPVSGIAFAVRSTVAPPYQADPEFPALKAEVAFGYLPGDPSQPPPVWTDLTNRIIGKDGDVWIKTMAGRQYELAQAEAGTLQIGFDNRDGALTPGSATAYPGLALGVPVRVSAYWQGAWYPLASGYVERWPQQWPDLPQFGLSVMVATDAISIMAAVNMTSALLGEILIDAPYLLLAASEQYLSFSNGLNSFGGSGVAALGYYTVADSQGQLAQNFSRTNQRAGMYADGVGTVPGGTGPAIAATGQTTNLLGSADTGFGTSAFGTTAPTLPVSGPGIVYTDPNLPGPIPVPSPVGTPATNGVTVTFGLIIPVVSPTPPSGLQPTVFTAFGPPSNYRQQASLSVQVKNHTANTVQVTLADGSTVSAPFFPNMTAQQITLCVTSFSLSIYVNGTLGAVTGLTPAQTTPWNAVMLGNANYAYAAAGMVPGNFTAFSLAVFGYQLPVQRIMSQYSTAISGQQNADSLTRVAQILSWAGLGLPRAGRATFNGAAQPIAQGPAYSLGGSTASAAVNQVAASESGMVAVMPQGALTYFHRWALFNQVPAVVFGDNSDPTAGEIPYQPAASWDYDNSYLTNSAAVAQQFGPNNLFTFTAADFTSRGEYFARAGQARTISTMSSLDPPDLANWSVAKYSQPSLRVAGIIVDAAANPAQAFPAVLSLVQGQVATVTRRPLGGAVISQNVMVQKIEMSIGAKSWKVAYQLSPYFEGNMLQLDAPGFDSAGGSALA